MADDGHPIEGPALKTVVGMIKDMEYQVYTDFELLWDKDRLSDTTLKNDDLNDFDEFELELLKISQ